MLDSGGSGISENKHIKKDSILIPIPGGTYIHPLAALSSPALLPVAVLLRVSHPAVTVSCLLVLRLLLHIGINTCCLLPPFPLLISITPGLLCNEDLPFTNEIIKVRF